MYHGSTDTLSLLQLCSIVSILGEGDGGTVFSQAHFRVNFKHVRRGGSAGPLANPGLFAIRLPCGQATAETGASKGNLQNCYTCGMIFLAKNALL